MSIRSEEYQKHIDLILEILRTNIGTKAICHNKTFRQLSYDDIAGVLHLLSLEIGPKSDFRPFFPKANPTFSATALETACLLYKSEGPDKLCIDSAAAATFFAIHLGAVQLMVCWPSEPISKWYQKSLDLPNLESYSKSAAKRADETFSKITNSTPQGQKPTGCLVLLCFLGALGAACVLCGVLV